MGKVEAERKAEEERMGKVEAERKAEEERMGKVEAERKAEAEKMARDDDNGVGFLLRKGLPPLLRSNISVSGPNYGSHTAINGYVDLVDNTLVGIPDCCRLAALPQCPSQIWKQTKYEGNSRALGHWNNEINIQNWVELVLIDIVTLLRLDKEIVVNNQVSLTLVQHLIPDILFFRISGSLIGVCEVKQPSFDQSNLSVVNDNLKNQIYNYLIQMRFVHGVKTPIGIISTYKEWRICFLKESLDLMSSTNPLNFEVSVTPSDPTTNKLFVSRLYMYDDPTLIEVLAATIYKMKLTQINPPTSLIRSLPCDEPRRFGCVTNNTFNWVLLPRDLTIDKLTYEMPATHTKWYYFIQDFHGGRDGRVWLSMNEGGKLAVIKISRERSYETEVKNWQDIWDQNNVRQLTLLDANAMIMPVVFHGHIEGKTIFFRPIGPKWSTGTATVEDIRNSEVKCNFDESLETYFNEPIRVASEAITEMARKGYQHNDLHWRHVGLLPYHKGDGVWAVKPVMIDLHEVTHFGKNLSKEELSVKAEEVIAESLRELTGKDEIVEL